MSWRCMVCCAPTLPGVGVQAWCARCSDVVDALTVEADARGYIALLSRTLRGAFRRGIALPMADADCVASRLARVYYGEDRDPALTAGSYLCDECGARMWCAGPPRPVAGLLLCGTCAHEF